MTVCTVIPEAEVQNPDVSDSVIRGSVCLKQDQFIDTHCDLGITQILTLIASFAEQPSDCKYCLQIILIQKKDEL